MNNFKSGKSLFGISSGSSSGSSGLFVDLISNQSINGIKTFLNNLITNSDVNFNTSAGVGRIIFNPNEPAGSGSQIVAIYTEDENDGQGWFFDSVGNLYYLGGGISPVKIMLSGATGDLTILSNFNGFGDVICHNILTSNIISSNSGGDITFNNGIALGSNTINSGNITSTGFLNVNNIISNTTTGLYPTAIALSNEFIDTNNSSLDIVATYIGFASPTQTLTTASNYMYIKPLTTGDFEMRILNKTKFILKTDIALNAIASQIAWAWMDESNIIHASINPNTTASTTNNAVCKFYARVVDTSLYYTRNGTLGSQNETSLIIIWRIDDNGNIFTSGTVNANTINPNSGTAIASASIWNFKDATNTTNITLNPTTASGNRLQITGISGGTTFLYYNTSNVLAVFNSITGANVWSIDGTTGNFNTIGTMTYSTLSAPTINATTSLKTNLIELYSGTILNIGITQAFNWLKSSTANRIRMFPASTIGDIFQICRTGDNAYGDGYWYWNNGGNCGYVSSGIVRWEILNTGGMNLTSDLNISNRVIVSPAVVAGEIMTVRITAGLEPRFHFSTNSNFGFWSGTAHTYYVNGPTGNITTNGSLTCGPINCSTILITNNTNTALTLSSGGIHLQNNNWLFGRCKFGDADYAYIAEYDTIDSDKLYLFGANGIYCNTLPVVVSDKRLKENIEDFIIHNPLEIIDKIRLVEYNRIDNPSKTRVLGYIAQEIQEIFPKAVEIDQTVIKKDENSVLFKKHKDGTDSEEPEREERLALNYSYISMLNTEAIKQLNELVQKQQILIDTLIKRIEILENS